MQEDDETPQAKRLSRKDWLIVFGLLAVALAIRLFHLNYESLWFDELWTWKVANQPDLRTLMTTGLQEDVHLPSYFVIVYWFMKWFGDSETVIRMPSVIFSALAAPALFLLGRRILNARVGLIAASLLILDYQSIHYGQEARPYAMMLFLGIVTTYLWFELIQASVIAGNKPSLGLVLGLWVTVAISCYTHYFSVILTLFQFAFYFGIAVKNKRTPWLGMSMLVALGLIAIPWLPELRLQLKNLVNWIPQDTYLHTLFTHSDLTFTWSFWAPYVTLAQVATALPIAFMLAFLYRKGTTQLKEESSYEYGLGWVLFLAWLLPWLATETISVVYKPIYWPRYLLYCAPFAYLLFAQQLDRLRLKTDMKIAIPILYMVAALAFLQTRWQVFTVSQRDDWRSVQSTMADQTPKDGATALLAITERPGVEKYYQNRFSPNLTDTAEITSPDQVSAAVDSILVKKPKYVWFFTGQYRGHEEAVKAAFKALQPYIAATSPAIQDARKEDVAAILIQLRP